MTALTDALAWVVIASFGASALLYGQSRRYGRYASVAAWVVFAVFWGLLVPHFAFEQRSIVEGVLSAAAVPACLYTAYLVAADRKDLETLTQAVAIMGLLYLPFQTLEPLQRVAIETVTHHAEWLMAQFGYTPPVVQSDAGYRAKFVFTGVNAAGESGHLFTTTVVLACTGVGSMAIVGGLALAVDAPLERRLQGLAIALPIIYVLNVIRITFIALAHGNQWFDGALVTDIVLSLFTGANANMVSYLLADRILAQTLSVVALVALTFALLRIIPELGGVVEDVAYIATGNEYEVTRRFAKG
ncbi:archaeosortase A [Halobacterium zhouii]|uniref:archaeosortase A n=1 Tax=Halobacterium zhouii TaxID=2902624 RepID=UPI001E44AEA5|nr:archaeosortase A [Halobacterium zhouii]